MTDLTTTLQAMFPDADFNRDIIMQDDGNGPFIAEWNLSAKQPTKAQIAAFLREHSQPE